jgi:hypothetical protein
MLSPKEIDLAVSRDSGIHFEMAESARRYEGHWPNSLKPFWCPSDKDGNDNYIVNLSKVAVDTCSHFLFGNGVDIEVNGQGDTPEDIFTQGFWDDNDKDQFLIDLATVGSVCGHTFVRIHAETPFPRLEILDPQNVSVLRNPLNYNEVIAFIIRANAHDSYTQNTVQYQEVIERENDTWVMTQSVQGIGGVNRVVGEPVLWPYSWPPIFHAKNLPSLNQFWGTADLSKDVQRANQALNFALSNTNRIVRLQGHAKTFIKGIDASSLNEGPLSQPSVSWNPDDITVLESDSAEVFQVAPGVDIGSHLAYVQELTSKLSDGVKMATAKRRLEGSHSCGASVHHQAAWGTDCFRWLIVWHLLSSFPCSRCRQEKRSLSLLWLRASTDLPAVSP